MIKYVLAVIFLISGIYGSAQETGCKVKILEISGSYSGECKKGLAHGHGIATGIDQYEGDFFKGIPEGRGKYKWANGSWYDGEWKNGMRNGEGKFVSGDTVIQGYWKADKYQGKVRTASYRIVVIRNVARYTITKSVEAANGVTIKVLLGGTDNSEIEDFSLAYTSGSEYRNTGTYGIQNTSVPLDVVVRYRTWNQLHSAQYDVLFEFTINDPGTWNVTIINM
jgi:hypothetical protein